ncbi:maker276 [Drosophila busckii]|uniref:Decapping nuclease n=1 Tax=Drosophila busckii TaxID=30019 RepID=A0A0M4EI45_DROBS|nr:uncharacterized protein LOC108606077 [Drosophila busckii]ALC48466.1 maker276 [Drosophila busckii]
MTMFERYSLNSKTSLTNLKLVHVLGWDGKKLRVPKTVGYYREPQKMEFPIDLKYGFDKFVPMPPECFNVLHGMRYLMQLKPEELFDQPFDFCTNRRTLLELIGLNRMKMRTLVASKFNGCIYIKTADNVKEGQADVIRMRDTYVFKLRQSLVVDKPGDLPDIEQPIIKGKQNYGIFTAELDTIRLLYSAELTGVENSELLGNFSDPAVLQQCNLASIKILPNHMQDDYYVNYRMRAWLLQAHFANIKRIHLGFFNENGQIVAPLITEYSTELLNKQHWCLQCEMRVLRTFLEDISMRMANEDCPYTTHIFHVKGSNVKYEVREGKNEYSFLDQEFIDFMKLNAC